MLSQQWPYDYVEIEWLDAEAQSGWEKVGEQPAPEELVTTIGFLIQKGKMLTIAMSIYFDKEDETYSTNGRIHIPKSMVKKITVLQKKASKPKSEKTVENPAA